MPRANSVAMPDAIQDAIPPIVPQIDAISNQLPFALRKHRKTRNPSAALEILYRPPVPSHEYVRISYTAVIVFSMVFCQHLRDPFSFLLVSKQSSSVQVAFRTHKSRNDQFRVLLIPRACRALQITVLETRNLFIYGILLHCEAIVIVTKSIHKFIHNHMSLYTTRLPE